MIEAVATPVEEDVRDGVADFGGRAEDVRVVAVGEDGAATGLGVRAVDEARGGDLEGLHAAGELHAIVRLDDEVDVVALDRDVDDAEGSA